MTSGDSSREGISRALGRVPSGLFIVTAGTGESATGFLASWVQQSSFEPPMVSVGIKKERPVLGVILEEKKRQVDLRFEQSAEDSVNRVRLLREKQTLIGRLETLSAQIDHVDQAVGALATLSDTTNEIHRHGRTRVLATTVWDGDIPDYLVDAIERNSVMTVRLQATDAVYAPEFPEVASALPCEDVE